jgi:hypothetical protein
MAPPTYTRPLHHNTPSFLGRHGDPSTCVDGRIRQQYSGGRWFLGFHTIFLMHIQPVYTVFVRRGNPMNQERHRPPPSRNSSIGTSRWIALRLKGAGYFSKRACIKCPDRIGHKMMEPSLQRRSTLKAWGSPCKKREDISTWKGKSQRIAELGGGCTLGVT